MFVLSLGLAVYACASAAPSGERQLNRAFSCIQIHEARIEYGRTQVARADLDCGEICIAAGNARDHETRLCRVAQRIADADALVRCRRANAATESIERRAHERCVCVSGAR